MGNRLLTMLLILMAIQVALIVVDKQTVSNTALWGFFYNPTGWTASDLIGFFSLGAIGISAGMIIGGIIFKNDLMVFAGYVASFISFGTPIYGLWNVINREAIFGTSSALIASIIVSPLAIMYTYFVINWWRGNSEV